MGKDDESPPLLLLFVINDQGFSMYKVYFFFVLSFYSLTVFANKCDVNVEGLKYKDGFDSSVEIILKSIPNSFLEVTFFKNNEPQVIYKNTNQTYKSFSSHKVPVRENKYVRGEWVVVWHRFDKVGKYELKFNILLEDKSSYECKTNIKVTTLRHPEAGPLIIKLTSDLDKKKYFKTKDKVVFDIDSQEKIFIRSVKFRSAKGKGVSVPEFLRVKGNQFQLEMPSEPDFGYLKVIFKDSIGRSRSITYYVFIYSKLEKYKIKLDKYEELPESHAYIEYLSYPILRFKPSETISVDVPVIEDVKFKLIVQLKKNKEVVYSYAAFLDDKKEINLLKRERIFDVSGITGQRVVKQNGFYHLKMVINRRYPMIAELGRGHLYGDYRDFNSESYDFKSYYEKFYNKGDPLDYEPLDSNGVTENGKDFYKAFQKIEKDKKERDRYLKFLFKFNSDDYLHYILLAQPFSKTHQVKNLESYARESGFSRSEDATLVHGPLGFVLPEKPQKYLKNEDYSGIFYISRNKKSIFKSNYDIKRVSSERPFLIPEFNIKITNKGNGDILYIDGKECHHSELNRNIYRAFVLDPYIDGSILIVSYRSNDYGDGFASFFSIKSINDRCVIVHQNDQMFNLN